MTYFIISDASLFYVYYVCLFNYLITIDSRSFDAFENCQLICMALSFLYPSFPV